MEKDLRISSLECANRLISAGRACLCPKLIEINNAPSFAAIANREGLNDDKLSTRLADAHSYPEAKDLDLSTEKIDVVADYMITFRRADYAPEH